MSQTSREFAIDNLLAIKEATSLEGVNSLCSVALVYAILDVADAIRGMKEPRSLVGLLTASQNQERT